MIKRLTWMLLALAVACAPTLALAKNPTALFYLMNTQKSTNSFLANVDKIDVVVPTWYGVDQNGLVNGTPNMYLYDIAKQKNLRVMPILSMTTGRDGFHKLMHDEAAKKRMIESLLIHGKQHKYYGFQFDFENIAWTDRDAYTLMVKQTADALHKAGFKMSVAVVPNAPGHAEGGQFSKWMWEYWRGAYDLKALGQAADLVSIMTYDQHTRWTTPGPVDGMVWMKKHLDYAITQLPEGKALAGYCHLRLPLVHRQPGEGRRHRSVEHLGHVYRCRRILPAGDRTERHRAVGSGGAGIVVLLLPRRYARVGIPPGCAQLQGTLRHGEAVRSGRLQLLGAGR